MIALWIFHGDLNFFDLHEKSLDLSKYEILPHKILKSRTLKKSSIVIDIKKILLGLKKIFYLKHQCVVCVCSLGPVPVSTGPPRGVTVGTRAVPPPVLGIPSCQIIIFNGTLFSWKSVGPTLSFNYIRITVV